MAKYRNLSLLENLPDELLYHKSEAGIGRHLAILDLSQLTQVSRRFCIFQNDVNTIRKKVTELFQFVKKADYDEVEKLVNAKPSLMFIPLKLLNGSIMSPLQYTFKVYDTEMWQICLKAIQDHQDQKLMDYFTQQLNEPINHIDLQPLFDAYEYYIMRLRLWLNNQISDEKINADWLNLAKAQAKNLQWYMLRLFCDEKTNWIKQPLFKVGKGTRPKRICEVRANYGNKQNEKEPLNLDRLGYDFGLISSVQGDVQAIDIGSLLFVQKDSANFRLLLDLRKADFEKLKLQSLNLTQKANDSPHYMI